MSLLSGCAKPNRVTTFKSPVDGVFYTVETYNGSGPVDPDFTRVYAHLERAGESVKKLVLDGSYLDIPQIKWADSHDVTVCMKSGVTNTFHSEVTLTSGGATETIHNRLDELCNARQ
jgi:hypothetical protein